MNIIRDSEEPERRLEVIILEIEHGNLIPNLSSVKRFTPDGAETLEYGIAWTTVSAYNDVLSDTSGILRLMDDGMSFETAINFLGIIPTPDTEEESEELVEIERITNENEYFPTEREWQTSGPFQLDKSEYAIGEKIFLRVSGLGIDEKGEIAFMRPISETAFKEYTTISFDGAKKDGFNYYIDPQISTASEIYSIDELVGKWIVVFRETNYQNLKFKITEKVLPGTNTESVPKKLTIASFVDKTKDPQSYIDRYNNEPTYKKWFHDNYPEYDSIEQAVGLELTEKIPDWVKNIFGWYAADQVSEYELLNAIKYLINEGILVVD